MLHVVTGAPCSGKTTFVAEHKAEGDIVIDLDALGVALGASEQWRRSESINRVALAARKAAIDAVGDADAWLIHTQPTDEQRASYVGATFHDLDPGIDECLERARTDGRPHGTEQAIRDYYAKRGIRRDASFHTKAPHGARPTSRTGEGRPAMAEEITPTETTEEAPQGASETDWKAEARKWESRAKANRQEADSLREKAAKWDEHELADMTEAEKATKRAEEAEGKLAALLAERQHAADAAEVSKASGVPADLLEYCNDREAMEKFAEQYGASTHVPAAASAPSTRIVRGDEKPANRSVFAAEFSKLLR